MPEARPKMQIGASPGKLLLAAGLAVALTVVLIVQFSGTSNAGDTNRSKRPKKTADRAAPPTSRAGDAPRAPEPVESQPAVNPWPKLGREEVLEYDPFTLPVAISRHQVATEAQSRREAEARQRREELAQKEAAWNRALDTLQREGVTAVIGDDRDGNVAVIGSRILRVGDDLEGFRIIAIEPDGVVLQQPTHD
ncbi:MAG: hypothetical protein JXB62_23495 [Pirellulales bacterium]|nr:hypothetical protein [Pirellulales bacterium]